MRHLSKQDLHDILLGAAILGTGGGGSLEHGIKIIDKALEDGCVFTLASAEEIPEDALVGTPYGCGSVGILSTDMQKIYNALDKIDTTPEVAAVKTIEKYLNKSLYGLIATELGGANTAVALEAGARLGKPIIDADPAGRSVPCLQHSTYYLENIPIYPMAIANEFGDTMLIVKAANDERAEALTRAAAVASFNHVGVVDHIGEWKKIKNALLLNTITLCLKVGQTAREAQNNNRNYAYDVSQMFGGKVIFEGIVTSCEWEDRNGFTYSDLVIKGINAYNQDELKIWIQNENIISFKNGEYFVTVPDSINIVVNQTNMPLLNPNAKIGMEVTVFALKAFDKWRTKKGIEILGPGFFGHSIEYRKLEELL
ncbi:MAG: DUF917 domain-containing protein [Tissierellales bacterium]|nr:DUF917 domain-containing protein [Tissierellales bacterium]